jgi:hypothetical protein
MNKVIYIFLKHKASMPDEALLTLQQELELEIEKRQKSHERLARRSKHGPSL